MTNMCLRRKAAEGVTAESSYVTSSNYMPT